TCEPDGELMASTSRGRTTPRRPMLGSCGTSAVRAHCNSPCRQPLLPVLAGHSPSAGVVSVDRYREDGRDWRKLQPNEIARQLMACSLPVLKFVKPVKGVELRGSVTAAAMAPPLQRRQGIMAAVATGLLQALKEGSYWAPGFDVPNAVECTGVLAPMSRISPLPDLGRDCDESRMPELSCSSSSHPLEVCQKLALHEEQHRVALVQFTATGEPSSSLLDFGRYQEHEAKLLLQTTFLQA
ncbi:unnamed protein product, partial [Polarella glacialis]